MFPFTKNGWQNERQKLRTDCCTGAFSADGWPGEHELHIAPCPGNKEGTGGRILARLRGRDYEYAAATFAGITFSKSTAALDWPHGVGDGSDRRRSRKERGIAVFASPEGNCNAVAEHALGLLLSLQKKIASSAEEVRKGLWLREENRGEELEGKTVGLIGFGHTGRAFAKLLRGFDVTILAYDPLNQEPYPDHVQRASLAQIQAAADVLSFHVPIGRKTRHYFDETFLAALQKPVLLLNTSRGEIVKSSALEVGILSGKIRSAGLDVWEQEPLEKMGDEEKSRLSRLAQMPQVLVTPHIAGYSAEALYKMSAVLLKKVRNQWRRTKKILLKQFP